MSGVEVSGNSQQVPESSTKKKKAGQGKKVREKCIDQCQPGKNNSCCRRSRKRKENHLSCVEVKQLLQGMGITNLEDKNLCTMAAIQKGFIQVEGKPEDLDMVVFEAKGECGHMFKPTLKQLLEQPDYSGTDYEDGAESATVKCPENPEECSGQYATNLCIGRPELDCGKFHNHCRGCPGFGRCLNDYRSSCYNKHGVHTNKVYFVGLSCNNWTDSEDEEEERDCSIM